MIFTTSDSGNCLSFLMSSMMDPPLQYSMTTQQNDLQQQIQYSLTILGWSNCERRLNSARSLASYFLATLFLSTLMARSSLVRLQMALQTLPKLPSPMTSLKVQWWVTLSGMMRMKLLMLTLSFLKRVVRSMLFTFTYSPFYVFYRARFSISSSSICTISRLFSPYFKCTVFLRILSAIWSSMESLAQAGRGRGLLAGALAMLLRVLTFNALEFVRKIRKGSLGRFSEVEWLLNSSKYSQVAFQVLMGAVQPQIGVVFPILKWKNFSATYIIRTSKLHIWARSGGQGWEGRDRGVRRGGLGMFLGKIRAYYSETRIYYIDQFSMGGQQSQPAAQQSPNIIPADLHPEDENHFFVEELTKVSLKGRRQVSYYWIDPRVYNAENQKYYNQFLQNFKIDSFTSIEGLKAELEEVQNNEIIKVITAASLPDDDYKYLQSEKKVAEIFLFCGNEEKAKLLKRNFNKIGGFGLKCPQVIEVIKQSQSKDKLDVPPATLLSMLEEDRKSLNKYRLNYYCITSKQAKNVSKKDFAELAKFLCPDESENVDKFEGLYDIKLTGESMFNQALQWAFDDNFYFKLMESLPKATTDPKKLAYLRLPFNDLWQAIYHKHKDIQKTPDSLYIVAQLNPREISMLQDHDTLDNFIIFTSFIKGYTKKTDAIKDFKERENSFLFEVTFTKNQRHKELDFGFVINDDKTLKKNVIFNIYNFFKLEEIDVGKRTGTLIYGPLTEAYQNRSDQTSKKRLTENETILLRNYDYLQNLIEKDNSQAVILQMSGYFKQTLQVYDRKVEYLKKINAPEAELNKYIILRGDAFRLNEDYEEAEREYRSIKDEYFRLVGLVHLLELYLKKGDNNAAQAMQVQLESSSNMRKLKEKFIEEYFKAENYFGLALMKQGKIKDALKKFKNLQNESSIFYNYKFEGIPIVHDIFRNMATCEAKLNNHKEALNLLNSTKDWQLVCEGESAGLALTETMIKNVYNELGNTNGVKETEQAISKRNECINLSQRKFLNQSTISISMGLNPVKNVNQSNVSVNMNMNYNVNQSGVSINLNEAPTITNINQSGININLSEPKPKAPVNINNSSVDIAL